jgi:adenosine deaminase
MEQPLGNPESAEIFRAVPKAELHQHVDGSIPSELTWSLMQQYGLSPVETYDEMRRLLVLQPEERGSLLHYLDKFNYPLWVTQFYENIAEATFEIAVAAYENGVRALELRYAPIIHTHAALTVRQAINSALSGLNRAENELSGLRCGLIVIAMRQAGPHVAKILARQAVAEAQHLHKRVGVVGFDVAGAERGNPPVLFRDAFHVAHAGGLKLTVHAGEDEGAWAVWQAVDELGADRIGHGCSAVQDRELIRRLARDRILVECCLTSNFQTGAASEGSHPIVAFLEAGVPVAVCTDNTTVSDTSQIVECRRAAEIIGVQEVLGILERSHAFSFVDRVRSYASPDPFGPSAG